jgi:hypothetical protein
MSDDDLRAILHDVDDELDHERVRRTVHARTAARPARWVPLAAAAAVAAVLLASVGVLSWATGRGEPSEVPPSATSVDPGTLRARVQDAVAAGSITCTQVLRDGQVVAERLRADRPRRSLYDLAEGGDVERATWPGCGPTASPVPTAYPTAWDTAPVRALLDGDLLAPVADPAYDATEATATRLVLERGSDHLVVEFELDPATTWPVAVRVAGQLAGRISWFPYGSAQDRFLLRHGRPAG